MRVISGSAKGRKLKVPSLRGGKRIRPLSDFAKEGLFNILSTLTEEADFLDLFAGSGQVGIEALSRGARTAMFVEIDRNAVVVIRQNLESTELADRGEIFSMEVNPAISMLDRKKAKFDLIFIGAPYGLSLLGEAVKNIAKSDILKDKGIVIAERSKKQELKIEDDSLVLAREVSYGDTVFSFYKRA